MTKNTNKLKLQEALDMVIAHYNDKHLNLWHDEKYRNMPDDEFYSLDRHLTAISQNLEIEMEELA